MVLAASMIMLKPDFTSQGGGGNTSYLMRVAYPPTLVLMTLFKVWSNLNPTTIDLLGGGSGGDSLLIFT